MGRIQIIFPRFQFHTINDKFIKIKSNNNTMANVGVKINFPKQ